jgi:hypothetical protein
VKILSQLKFIIMQELQNDKNKPETSKPSNLPAKKAEPQKDAILDDQIVKKNTTTEPTKKEDESDDSKTQKKITDVPDKDNNKDATIIDEGDVESKKNPSYLNQDLTKEIL